VDPSDHTNCFRRLERERVRYKEAKVSFNSTTRLKDHGPGMWALKGAAG